MKGGGGGGYRCQYYVKYYVMYTVSCRWILSKPFHQIKPCSTMRGKLKYYTCTVYQYFAIEYFASIYELLWIFYILKIIILLIIINYAAYDLKTHCNHAAHNKNLFIFYYTRS